MKKSLTQRGLPMVCMMIVMLGMYFLSMFVAPGAVTFALSAFALTIILITALARVNDINIKLTGIRWGARRLGLLMTAAGAAGVILLGDEPPAWKDTMLHLGVALTWFTTPNMPPWWKWISGKEVPNPEMQGEG